MRQILRIEGCKEGKANFREKSIFLLMIFSPSPFFPFFRYIPLERNNLMLNIGAEILQN